MLTNVVKECCIICKNVSHENLFCFIKSDCIAFFEDFHCLFFI